MSSADIQLHTAFSSILISILQYAYKLREADYNIYVHLICHTNVAS